MMNRLMKYFQSKHLKSPLKEVSINCFQLAKIMDDNLPETPEKTVGMRKLLEAKDCFVRAKLDTVRPAHDDVRNG